MTQKGVWDLQGVRDEYLAGNWEYASNDPYSLYVWGTNSGTLGLNELAPRSSPTQVPGTQWSREIKDLPLTIKTDGTAWAWGNGGYGGLGQNDLITRSSPIQIPGTQWDRVGKHSNLRTSSAFKTDGTLWVWGHGGNGMLGHNETGPRSSPIQLPGTWNHVSSGENIMYGSTTSGELYFWGRGLYGTHGQNHSTNVSYSSPVQIPGTGWNKVFAANGSYSGYFTKTDGSLWALGDNDFGALGLNDKVRRSLPYQIPGTQWDTVYAGTQGVMATKTDGTMWVWGTGSAGVSGQGDTIPRSSPVQIPGTQWALGYNRMARPFYSTLALKTDGTMWAWGQNNNGQYGDNSRVIRSSPVQIPGTWTRVSSLGQSSFAATKNS